MADLDARERGKVRRGFIAYGKANGIPYVCVTPNCSTGDALEVHHIDCNSENNEWSNLEWHCKRHHNMKHNYITWADVTLNGLTLPLTQKQPEILEILTRHPDNKEFVPLLKRQAEREGYQLKSAVLTQLKKRGSGEANPTASTKNTGLIAILYRGITVEVRSGETVRFLGPVL